ncbi:DUF1810 domain-containing protein [Pedobacter boryungensis]|uniref:DUF1810 domain-containing protein n=1 Tax=Pedobacter boryungensis TaxID=869962 RepID=A0ABX2DCC2_9SPHI|nr:DUF1810 domain-containing protein [Pedobacter boryungensis]NQX31088.1 DUF1810 domain-containing protein [Pedobacter boryungensis]
MTQEANLDHFITAQAHTYTTALREIKNGKKTSHWMWFVFPQLEGLGHSEMAIRYGIKSLKQAEAYLSHPILGQRLIEISTALLQSSTDNATELMGSPDDLKLRSSMTLFSVICPNSVFNDVLDQFFKGEKDPKTLRLLGKSV